MPTQTLGRDKDPRLPSDLSPISLWLRKAFWTLLSSPGLRVMSALVYPRSTISHLEAKSAVAFTIDDGFCGVDNPGGCLLEEVRMVFKRHGARATFFVAGSHCEHTTDAHVAELLKDGHELANHGMRDHPYTGYSAQAFDEDLAETQQRLSRYRSDPPRWYRAPFGRLNKRMREGLDRRNLTHVVCDAFANDTSIPDAPWIARFVLRRSKPGSIILIHMPERGCREWNLEAMRLTLEGLAKKRLQVVTLSELEAM